MKKQMLLQLNIIMLFTTAIIFSIVPQYMRGVFGDEYCLGHVVNIETHKLEYLPHKWGGMHMIPTWHWGYGHWLFFLGGLTLFVLQAVYIGKTYLKD